MDKIRVVLADDHQQMIAIVRRTLGEGFEVVGAVEDGRQAVNAVRSHLVPYRSSQSDREIADHDFMALLRRGRGPLW